MSEPPLPDAATARGWWAAMVGLRRFEERCAELRAAGRIAGFLHSARGEEAAIVGAAAALWDGDDVVLCTFRAHAWALVRGTPEAAVFAELLGRPGGTNGGVGGSTHVVDVERGVLGGFGIPAGHAPLAVGAALSLKTRGEPGVAVAQLTLGATAEGAFAEALALAGSWSLPVVFLVTNDVSATHPAPTVTDVFQRSAAHGVAGLRCSGADPVVINHTMSEAVARARAGRPTLVEALVDRTTIDPLPAFADRIGLDDAQRTAIEASIATRHSAALVEADA
jgi:pyruvate dehydrogenase E1 component alpha subunit